MPSLVVRFDCVQLRPAFVQDYADVLNTLQRLQAGNRQAFGPDRLRWRGDRLGWVIQTGFTPWFLEKMCLGRTLLPRSGALAFVAVRCNQSGMATIEFSGVTVAAKANVYFDGRVVSHTIVLADGSRKTLGLIHPGEYHFATGAPERMEIIAGHCEVRLDGSDSWKSFGPDGSFAVAGDSGFTIRVDSGLAEYVCSFA